LTERIAIIGAGLAGATAARLLLRDGADVTIFEKSGGTGGRLATRRTAYGTFDHGAQYITAKGDGFRDTLYRFMAEGTSDVWAPEGKDRGMEWHVGVPGMSSFVKPMLGGIDVKLRAKVVSIDTDGAGIGVTIEGADRQRFDRVFVTAPAPQSHDLLRGLDPAFDVIGTVEMAPCWAAMLGYGRQLVNMPDVYRGGDDEALAWAARDSSKPGREGFENIVVHAGGGWSKRHLEADSAEILKILTGKLAEIAGNEALSPVHSAVHRWRHARVDKPVGVPFISGCEGRVVACGDWCLGGRAEAAFDSGRLAAVNIANRQLA
jgi:renalase